jgi:preprotein translocase subunit Sec63
VQKTYYDILKVAQDVPIEVIRAAYRVLSLKYHPDRLVLVGLVVVVLAVSGIPASGVPEFCA